MSSWESEMTPEEWESVQDTVQDTVQDKSWSKQYYENLTEAQHQTNDDWFKNTLRVLKDTGILSVPDLQKFFNKNGVEIQSINKEERIVNGVNYYRQSWVIKGG